MISTLISSLFAFVIALTPFMEKFPYVDFLPWVLISSAVLIFLSAILLPIFAWQPLQKVEQNMAPQIVTLFQKNRGVRLLTVWLFVFPLISFILAFLFISKEPQVSSIRPYLFGAWFLLLGITFDCIHSLGKRILSYLNPYQVLEKLALEAKESIQNDRELDLCLWIDAISEIAIKAIQRRSLSLCHMALTEIQQLVRLFFASSKSISHQEQDKQSKAMGITDKVSYTTFYVYQRLEMAFEQALNKKLEPTCSHLVTILGKIAIDAAKFDISMAAPPLRFIGKFARRARDQQLDETVLKASCTLLEVGKIILEDIDVTYLEIKDPFFAITNNLEELAKEAFRRDKTANIAFLILPLQELKELFLSERVKNHQDAPVILASIDRILGEFQALQMVLSTIPDLSSLTKDEIESSS